MQDLKQRLGTGAVRCGDNQSIKSLMRSRRREPVIQVKCDYCGEYTETFVATPNHLLFCRIQTVGLPPEKDCMSDYNRSKSNAITLRKKNEEEQRLQTSKEQLQENKKEKEKIVKKFNDYLFELNQKSRRQRASK